jgi:transcriptional regulator with XRE-family HTH domain
MWTEKSDPEILTEIGRRIREIRLQRNMQQREIAEFGGLSVGAVQRLEKGEPVSTSNMLRILRALGMLENIELLVPKTPVSPILMKKLLGRKRERARK